MLSCYFTLVHWLLIHLSLGGQRVVSMYCEVERTSLYLLIISFLCIIIFLLINASRFSSFLLVLIFYLCLTSLILSLFNYLLRYFLFNIKIIFFSLFCNHCSSFFFIILLIYFIYLFFLILLLLLGSQSTTIG